MNPLRDLWPRSIRRRKAPRPQTAMSHFEVSGLHDLSTTIELRRDTASSMMAIFFGCLASVIVIGLWVGTFSKQETMRGIVLGTRGGQTITSVVEGTVSKVWVEQGQQVKAGEKLLTILPQQTATGSTPLSQTELRSLNDQLLNVRHQSAEMRARMQRDGEDVSKFDRTQKELLANLGLQEEELTKALAAQDEIVSKLRDYVKKGYSTRETLATQERIRQDYMQQLASVRLQRSQLAATSLERRRTVALNNAASSNQLAELDRLATELTAKMERARSAIATDILAARDGEVVAVNVREGSSVKSGDTIAAIGEPEAPFIIGLQAPSKTMGLVSVGQRVVLKYDAFPFKTFGVKYGHVISISAQPVSLPKEDDQQMAMLNPALAQAAKATPPQSKYLIEVEPEDRTILAYGQQRSILIGSTLSADVIVEKRRLIDWVLDPILALRGRT